MTVRSPSAILVTGGAGFIGSAFVRRALAAEGFDGRIVNYDLLTYAADPENVAVVASSPRYAFVHGDVCDEALLADTCDRFGIDAVVHFAAETHVDRSIAEPAPFLRTNVEGTFHLLEVVRARPRIHLHQVSTDEVYGSLGPIGRFTEQSPALPSSPYAASKAAADHLVRAYVRTYGISATLSHCGNNLGPHQTPDKLVPLAVTRLIERKPVPIFGDGSNVRDWIFVDDHVDALWAILHRGEAGETYDVSAGAERTNLELVSRLVEIVADSTRVPARELLSLITFVADRPGHDLRYAIDATKIRRELGWAPAHDFDEALARSTQWLIDNAAWIGRARQRIASLPSRQSAP